MLQYGGRWNVARMIALPDASYSFDMEIRASVRRNLASGAYSPEVAIAAERWLDEQIEQAAARARGLTVTQQSFVRRAVAAATGAALCSFITAVLVMLDISFHH
jgi:hypothetical protein